MTWDNKIASRGRRSREFRNRVPVSQKPNRTRVQLSAILSKSGGNVLILGKYVDSLTAQMSED